MYVLGLYSDGDYFKVSLISKKWGKIRIEFIKEFKKNIDNVNSLKKILNGKGSLLYPFVTIVSALKSEEVFLRKMIIPLIGDSKVKKALQFQLSSDEIYLDKDRSFVSLLKKNGKQTEVNLYGFTKDAMQSHIQDVKTLGVDLDCISTISKGLERFVQFFTIQKGPFFLFHLGWESSSLYFFKEGKMKQDASFTIGLKNIIDSVQKDQLLIDAIDMSKVQELFIEAIDGSKKSYAADVYFEIEKQLSRAWTYMIDSEKIEKESFKILFTGYSEFSKELKSYLPPLDLEEVKLIPHLEYSSLQLSSYAIEIGLALDQIISDKESLQLAQGEFTPPAQKIKGKKNILQYGALCFISAVFLFFTLNIGLIKQKEGVKRRYEMAVSKIDSLIGKEKTNIVYTLEAMEANKKNFSKRLKNESVKNTGEKSPLLVAQVIKYLEDCSIKSSYVEELNYNIIDLNEEVILELTIRFNDLEDNKINLLIAMLENQKGEIKFIQEPKIKEIGKMVSIYMKVAG